MSKKRHRFRIGDHLKVPRMGGAYTHHGIYVGGKRPIIHYSGDLTHKRNASIRRATLRQFAQDQRIVVVRYGKSLPPQEVRRRAESKLGENGYSLFGNNCEHFARWCKTGSHASEQVKDAGAGTAGAVGSAAATAAGLATVSAAGTAAGLSGAGIMSGLATVGAGVGGGAVAGVGVLATAPAALTTWAMRSALAHDEHATEQENNARAAGRVATVAGAALGVGGSVAAIYTAGTVTGLSGAGITSGLAAIGGTVGGGMAAGTAVTIAAPAAAAAAVGYAVYQAWKWLAD